MKMDNAGRMSGTSSNIILHCRYIFNISAFSRRTRAASESARTVLCDGKYSSDHSAELGINRSGSASYGSCIVRRIKSWPRPLFFMLFPTVGRLCIGVSLDPVWCHRWYQAECPSC